MCSSTSQQYRYNGFQERRDEDIVQNMLGDAVDQVSMSLPTHEDIVQSMLGDAVDQVFMSLPTHEDIKLFVDKDIKRKHHNEQHHVQQLKTAYQMQRMHEEGCSQHGGRTRL